MQSINFAVLWLLLHWLHIIYKQTKQQKTLYVKNHDHIVVLIMDLKMKCDKGKYIRIAKTYFSMHIQIITHQAH